VVGLRRVGAALARALPGLIGLALLAAPARGQAPAASVPYTVQVAALSDAEAAIDLSGELLRDGFPAYVVRAEGAVGSVFRVRVAAFGDRVSADRYAVALGERRGGVPRPALAEAIPAGILPLAPIRLFRVEGPARATVLEWGAAGVALRVGPADGPAVYRREDGTTFEAWWAAPAEGGGREEVARLALDDAAAADDEPAVRDALFRQRLRLVADQTGLDADALEGAAVRGAPGERHLVVWRRVDGGVAVLGVARAAASPASRAAEDWLGGVPPVQAPARLVIQPGPAAAERAPDATGDPASEDLPTTDGAGAPGDAPEREPAAEAPSGEVPAGEAPSGEAAPPAAEPAEAPAGEARADEAPALEAEPAEAAAVPVVEGDGWRARRDGIWTVLEAGGATWRALVGAPRDGTDDLLVLEVAGGRELVRLAPR
jgi:hypothetical protein